MIFWNVVFFDSFLFFPVLLRPVLRREVGAKHLFEYGVQRWRVFGK